MGQTIAMIAVMAVVFIILPAILKKLTGKDFIELLVGRPLFGKRRKDKASSAGQKEDGQVATGDSDKDGRKEKNSSQSDIYKTISDCINFARRNQYQTVIPGILKKGALETKLTMIIVMRSGVVGINTFGYGGAVSAKKDDETWTQTMNGESRQIPSPILQSERQTQFLKQFLAEAGYRDVDVSVVSVFTEKNVKVTGPMAAEIVPADKLIGELGKNRYIQTKDVDVKAVGKALSAYQFTAKDLRRTGRRK